MISERKLILPKYLPVEAIDLIDRLLQLDPFSRIGAGSPGSDNDFEKLKQHPFFKGINFKKLHSTPPPIPYERFQAALSSLKNREPQQSKDSDDEKDSDDDDEQHMQALMAKKPLPLAPGGDTTRKRPSKLEEDQ